MAGQFRKILVILTLGFVFFLQVMPVNAALIPALNPLCWKKAECDKVRASFLIGTDNKRTGDGWVKGDDPCVGGIGEEAWGKCLPAGVTNAQISIGGQGKFTNLGTYLQTVYNYALGIASILAVIMIIMAGVQWTTSGGNSEAITSAKKRITGSVVGLLIAYMSFFILNTINPALTALRLPQVWLVKSQVLGAEFCKDMAKETQFAFAADIGQTVDKAKYAKAGPFATLDKIKQDPDQKCGKQLFIQNGGGEACKTSFCPPLSDLSTQVCALDQADQKTYKCQTGNIFGTVVGKYMMGNPGCVSGAVSTVSGGLAGSSGFVYPFIAHERTRYDGQFISGLYVVCNDDSTARISTAQVTITGDDQKQTQNYKVAVPSSTINNLNVKAGANFRCTSVGGAKGLVLAWEFNQSCFGWQGYFVAKDGSEIGSFSKVKTFDSNRLIQVDDLKNGIFVNIDVTNYTRD